MNESKTGLDNALRRVGRLVFPSLKNKLYKTLANFFASEALNGQDSFATIHGKATIMKKLLLLPLALITSGVTFAQEVGRVISATPIIQQVGVPRQVCTTEQVAVQQPKSGAGALMGAIAGGAMGNAVGGGAGKAAATLIGIIGGAAIGDNLEGGQTAQVQNVQRCATQTFYENRPVAFNVVYEYGGKQFSVQMPTDPGPTIQLQVNPVGGVAQTAPPYSNVTYAQPVYEQPTYVATVPVSYGYPGYYDQPNYVPVAAAVGLGFLIGAQGHGYGYGHGHWH
jgi:uncharacterized protein YcfJ